MFMSKNPYVHFLALIYADKSYVSLGLSPSCLELLNRIAAASLDGTAYTVSELMNSMPFASQVTIHRYMDFLIDRGFLELRHHSDRRTKYVYLTPLADTYLSRMGALMSKALIKTGAKNV